MAAQVSLLKPPMPNRASTITTHDIETGLLGRLIGVVTHPAAAFCHLRGSGRSHWKFVITLNIAALALAAASASSAAGTAAATSAATIGLSLLGSVALMAADLLLRTRVGSTARVAAHPGRRQGLPPQQPRPRKRGG